MKSPVSLNPITCPLVSMRQLTSAYGVHIYEKSFVAEPNHLPAPYVSICSIRQRTLHTSAYVPYVSIRSIREHTLLPTANCLPALVEPIAVSIRQHTSAYVSITATQANDLAAAVEPIIPQRIRLGYRKLHL